MAYESQQPQNYDPALSMIANVSTTWGSGGTTATVTDASVHPFSTVAITPTSLPNGFWKVVVSQGSFVITSSNAESSSLGFNYQIF